MGKRTNFKKNERDFYSTPKEAVIPLSKFLNINEKFCEPCAGDGSLIDHLYSLGFDCALAFDIEPQKPSIKKQDVFEINNCVGDLFITNPPWTWNILNPLIKKLSELKPSWLLLNADVMHNKRMSEHMKKCVKIVSIGRISWMQNKQSGFENCAWFLFDQKNINQTIFIGR
tara:strand:+ start:626 stop:1138 length:513 start_codon:yes stop_codon:yes gene_type:complete